jgi:D-beta-D-heptose 7-phosphate kinase/D-beta-D-heptose 1-phosphate adenosyltransferase
MAKHVAISADEKKRLAEAVARFPECRILVLGDLMLDVFLWGEVSRISPEAPVPVVEVREETRRLGGAANVIHNVVSLGGNACVAGVIGDDGPGRHIRDLLEQLHVSTRCLVAEQERPTTIKTRVIAQNQQVVRFDREWHSPIPSESRRRIVTYIKNNLPQFDGMIISDYDKGVINLEVMDLIRSLGAPSTFPVVVDPKVRNVELYRHMTMVTPNHHEAARITGINIHDEDTLKAAGDALLERLECPMVLITRGKDGMSLFRRYTQPVHISTVARRVYDVTGAGDTVIAALTLGIVAGLSAMEAALLANLAAGIVVAEVGTAAVSADQLLNVINGS